MDTSANIARFLLTYHGNARLHPSLMEVNPQKNKTKYNYKISHFYIRVYIYIYVLVSLL